MHSTKPISDDVALYSQLPWDLSVLTNLQELDLSMNSFQHIPEQCTWKDGHLATSLTKLSINQNILATIPEGERCLSLQGISACITCCTTRALFFPPEMCLAPAVVCSAFLSL
jgi:hypothetical protein